MGERPSDIIAAIDAHLVEHRDDVGGPDGKGSARTPFTTPDGTEVGYLRV
ncbi:hypothetical protein [Nocardia sp. NPDC046763]